jgi:hypothetical protein
MNRSNNELLVQLTDKNNIKLTQRTTANVLNFEKPVVGLGVENINNLPYM